MCLCNIQSGRVQHDTVHKVTAVSQQTFLFGYDLDSDRLASESLRMYHTMDTH